MSGLRGLPFPQLFVRQVRVVFGGADPQHDGAAQKTDLNGEKILDIPMIRSTSSKSATGIILAAGASTRLGRPKQLLMIDGKPLLVRVIQAAVNSDLDQIVLVLGHQAADIQKALCSHLVHPKLKVVVNRDHKTGMASSLQAGLRQIPNGFQTVMILLADHPFTDSSIINHLLSRFNNSSKTLCVPTYRGRRGHPVCLSQQFYDDMMSLSGDIGAREIIRNYSGQLLEVELDSDQAFLDIDTDADLERAISIGRCRVKT